MKLTKCDLENLGKLPEGKRFQAMDVWPAVKRTDYSLGRLVQAGYVTKTVTGYPIYNVYYRKLKTPLKNK